MDYKLEKQIRQYIATKRIVIHDMTKDLGYDYELIRRSLSGERLLRSNEFFDICRYLGLEIADFVNGGDGMIKKDNVTDIHKMIENAMEKKDRYVTIYFGEDSTSATIYPITGESTHWTKAVTDGVDYWSCSECGRVSDKIYPYCPNCGEKMKMV